MSTIWVKKLNKIVNKMNNTKSSMIHMKPKDAILLDKTYPDEIAVPEDGSYIYLSKMTGHRLCLE